MPGFIDAHSHVTGMANVEAHHVRVQVPPLADTSRPSSRSCTRRPRRSPRVPGSSAKGPITQIFPSREELDAAFPDNPVRLDWSAHGQDDQPPRRRGPRDGPGFSRSAEGIDGALTSGRPTVK